MSILRRFITPVGPHADSNIRRHYAIEDAAWVWHPDAGSMAPVVLKFTAAARLDTPRTLHIHVTGDERYELRLDGEHVSSGPHRSDVAHWSFASFTLDLPAGEHGFEAIVWKLGKLAPTAQTSHGGGFLFACEEMPELNTGSELWRVDILGDRTFTPYREPLRQYHATGPEELVDLAAGNARETSAVVPEALQGPLQGFSHGVRRGGWRLYPSPLPEMIRQPRRLGTVRMASRDGRTLDAPVSIETTDTDAAAALQAMIDGRQALEIPAHTCLWAIVDTEDYVCGYPRLTLSGGAGGEVRVEWAESLYHVDEQGELTRRKGHRAEVDGKRFAGFGDAFRTDGGAARQLTSLWWRAGRMIRLVVRTADEPLRIDAMNILETRYPLECESAWRSDDDDLQRFIPIAVRGIQMCSHETFMDCPHYEQLMYVGDGRLEMLVSHVISGDDRLTRRGIELFDWSRRHTGFVAERCPSDPYQLSVTFAMLWVLSLRDHAWWRDDETWAADRLIGARALMDEILALRQPDGLLHELPGWSFVDWVPQWRHGYLPPGTDGRPLATINLHLLMALESMVDLEQAFGEEEPAARYQRLADAFRGTLVGAFWDEDAALMRDAPGCHTYGEHAQCLALLADAIPQEHRLRCFQTLIEREDLWRTTVYFSFYLLETFYRFGQGDLLHQKLGFWKRLPDEGFTTPVEKPEPSRSDCHAWGSHPLFHMHSSLAGIRPNARGFRHVLIAPCPGPLQSIQCRQPHPRGWIDVDLRFDHGHCTAAISLPEDTPGLFRWAGQDYLLEAGRETTITA